MIFIAAHLALGALGALFMWRSVLRVFTETPVELGLALVIASLVGTIANAVAGRSAFAPRHALALDAISIALAVWWIAIVTLEPPTRDLLGASVVIVAAVRLAPAAYAVATGRAPAPLALLVAFGLYGAFAAWLPAASLPFGDQVHYLIQADRLASGRIDAAVDERLFTQLVGVAPSASDAATHVADTPLGPRPIQGYAMPLLLLPGWALVGRLGAHLTMALVAAWASYQTYLILRDLATRAGSPIPLRAAGATWAMTSFLAPLSLLATHLYPNAVGAALIATAFRYGFTAPRRRPALAAALLAATLLLTPRDAIALVVLLPFLLLTASERRAVLVAAGSVALVVVIANALLYGLPLPYAGYAYGTAQAQELTREPSIVPTFWVGLPAILFDRTHGLAGSAPWIFIGLIGLIPARRWERPRLLSDPGARPFLLPAVLAVGLSVIALSFFRLWEGGYAPAGRYFVDVLPLWAPFVAFGVAAIAARAAERRDKEEEQTTPWLRWGVRTIAAVLLFMSAISAVILNAIPSTALNTAFQHQLRDQVGSLLGIDPLRWLPTFQPITADWYIAAYLALIPAGILGLGLLLYGAVVGRQGTLAIRQGTLATSPPQPHEGSQLRGRPGIQPSLLVVFRSPTSVFVALNVVAIVVLLLAGLQPWVGTWPDPVPTSLLAKWLPFTLALTAVGSLVVARPLVPRERPRFLRRHFFLYLIALALVLAAYAGRGALLNGQLGAIYLAIPVAFALHALEGLWRAIGRDRTDAGATAPLTDRAAALQVAGIALVVFLALLPYHRAVMPTASDEPIYLLIVQSLLYDGDLDIRNDFEGDRYAAFYPSKLPDHHGVEVGRAIYPIRDLGLPLLSLAPFAVAGRLGVLALMCVVGAALAAQLYMLLRDLRFTPRVAFLAVVTTVLTHPILTYTTQVYPELLTALVFVSAARVLRRGTRTTPRDLAVASLLVAFLPVLSTRAWPIAVGVGLVIAYCAGGALRRIAAGAAPFAIVIGALSLANWVMFGLFMPSAGYYIIREQQQVLAYAPQVGLSGLFFDRVFGLIPRAPIYLLAFVGLVPLIRRARPNDRPELAALALGGLLSIAYISNIAYWWADGSPPSRYLLGAVPLFVVAVAAGWDVALAPSAWRQILVPLAWLTAALSALVTYVYAVLPNIRYDLALDIRASGAPGGFFALVHRVSGLDLWALFPSLVILDGPSVALAFAWVALAAGLVWLGASSMHRDALRAEVRP